PQSPRSSSTRRLDGWARSATWPTPLFSCAPTRRASSRVPACRSTAAWACKSPNPKNRNSGGMNMSEKKPVVVYGVSGYTGRLVCEYLREYNIPFIAAGRDAAKVKAVVEKIPGIETADYEVAEVEHTVEALTKLFKGAQVVSNMVGPFIKYGPEVVEACLAAGCHYTDTTGEQDWVLLAQERWGTKFAAKG